MMCKHEFWEGKAKIYAVPKDNFRCNREYLYNIIKLDYYEFDDGNEQGQPPHQELQLPSHQNHVSAQGNEELTQQAAQMVTNEELKEALEALSSKVDALVLATQQTTEHTTNCPTNCPTSIVQHMHPRRYFVLGLLQWMQ